MDKQAQEALENARSALSGAGSAASDSISDFIEGVKPHVERNKGPLLAALIGAIIGGGAGYASDGSVLGGAALGGVAGGATRLGMDFLTGDRTLMGEDPETPFTTAAIDATTNTALGNIGLLGGAGGGAYLSRGLLPTPTNLRSFIRQGEKNKITIPMRKGTAGPPRPPVKAIKNVNNIPNWALKDVAKQVQNMGIRRMPGWGAAAALPAAGAGAGFLLDRYLQGEY